MGADSKDVTQVLRRISSGDANASDELLPLVYDELRALAGAYLQRERAGHTLQPTALVHEVYLRLVQQADARWNDRAHFLAVAAQAIRRILIDHARKNRSLKRATPPRVSLDVASDFPQKQGTDLHVLNDALSRLEALNPRHGRVVEMRFFGGMSVEEVAEVLGVSAGTVIGDWRVARAWLQKELEQDE